jgi:hypothetical protein
VLGGIPASPGAPAADPEAADADPIDLEPDGLEPDGTEPVGPEPVGTVTTLLTLAEAGRDWLAAWAERGSLAPGSATGISLILGICAAGWFTAGTRIGNLYGALALGAGYLVTLVTREFLSPAAARAESLRPGRRAGPAGVTGLVSGTSAARAGWLTMLAARVSEYAVYAGLALGAVAEGWDGVWPLAIAVLALATICDTMTACTGPLSPARPGRSVEAAEDGAPDAGPAGAVAPGGRPAGELSRDGLAGRVVVTALTMPPGGRVLLIVALAPIIGGRAVLLGLLDWGIIAVCCGVGARSAGRRRPRTSRRHPLDAIDPSGGQAQAESVSLSVLLLPARPATVPDPDSDAGPLQPEDRRLVRADWADDGWTSDDGATTASADPVDAGLPGGTAAGPGGHGMIAADHSVRDRKTPHDHEGRPVPGRRPFPGRLAGARNRAGRPAEPAQFTQAEPSQVTNSRAAPAPPAQDAIHRSAAANDARKTAEQADQEAWDAELAADPQLPPDPGLPPPGSSGPRQSVARPDPGAADVDSDQPDPPEDPDLADEPDLAGRAGLGLAGLIGEPDTAPRVAAILRNRDDGVLARWFGRLARGQLMPLPPALLALAAVAMLAHLGLRDLPGLLILAPAIIMLVAAPGASHDHGGRFDWLVPAVLQGAQYVYIAALGFAAGVPAPITFTLCAVIALHYADLGAAGSPILLARRGGTQLIASGRPGPGRRPSLRPGWSARRARPRPPGELRLSQYRRHAGQLAAAQQAGPRRPPRRRAAGSPGDSGESDRYQRDSYRHHGPRDSAQPAPAQTELGTWMGWEGRMIACGLGAAMGIAWLAYLALTAYLGWLLWSKVRASYLGLRAAGAR